MKLTREEAVAKYGNQFVTKIESEFCEPTSRVIYPAFEPEHADMEEWATQGDILRAYYYLPAGTDPDNATWVVDHFEDDDIIGLQDLADFINSHDDWQLAVENLIEFNGWTSDCGTQYGICHSVDEILEFNEKGEAVVRSIGHDTTSVKLYLFRHQAEDAVKESGESYVESSCDVEKCVRGNCAKADTILSTAMGEVQCFRGAVSGNVLAAWWLGDDEDAD